MPARGAQSREIAARPLAPPLRSLLRMLRLAPVLVAALAAGTAGCVGEAAVSFQGRVVEGAATGHAFEPAPAAGVPIAGAAVALCFVACGVPLFTAEDGSYPELSAVFGGALGSDTRIAVRVTAPDGRTVEYATIYERSDDPLTANPSCDGGCPPVFLNFTLAP
jgi:hypothetical protein